MEAFGKHVFIRVDAELICSNKEILPDNQEYERYITGIVTAVGCDCYFKFGLIKGDRVLVNLDPRLNEKNVIVHYEDILGVEYNDKNR